MARMETSEEISRKDVKDQEISPGPRLEAGRQQ
jgi:hypothetical protein